MILKNFFIFIMEFQKYQRLEETLIFKNLIIIYHLYTIFFRSAEDLKTMLLCFVWRRVETLTARSRGVVKG